ncbi:hypothetical protein ILFOPFJJ_05585 [Ensifer psoraleae]|uniref:GcrA family cell cycle regulator n=1 Tax=Sinorhizobium psoraleae TaxID=520838 RepID=UPI00156A25F6|nr:GcrA family cell cycle regulator [Sinorhizobium psoraleae]NRP74663.1 hypothetical protein [Sinorhizobium psoraleae]
MPATWTEARVERLKSLWAEGLSASQIAGELGGVTRNAVIGKVHRLGLSGRAKGSAKPVRQKSRANNQAPAHPRSQAVRARIIGNTVLALPADEIEAEPLRLGSTVELTEVFPINGRLTLMELGETTCRWPIGDPRSSDFRFCGARITPGATYCSAHSCLAYQPRSSGASHSAPRIQSSFLRKST